MKETASNVYLRIATVDDALFIAQTLYRAFAEYESLYTPEAFAATVCSVQRV